LFNYIEIKEFFASLAGFGAIAVPALLPVVRVLVQRILIFGCARLYHSMAVRPFEPGRALRCVKPGRSGAQPRVIPANPLHARQEGLIRLTITGFLCRVLARPRPVVILMGQAVSSGFREKAIDD
jgi:hypothetical protein